MRLGLTADSRTPIRARLHPFHVDKAGTVEHDLEMPVATITNHQVHVLFAHVGRVRAQRVDRSGDDVPFVLDILPHYVFMCPVLRGISFATRPPPDCRDCPPGFINEPLSLVPQRSRGVRCQCCILRRPHEMTQLPTEKAVTSLENCLPIAAEVYASR